MSDIVKLIIEIPKEDYEFTKGAKMARVFPSEYYVKLILKGIPLDDVIGKIDKAYDELDGYDPSALGTFANRVSDILDNIGKESEG